MVLRPGAGAFRHHCPIAAGLAFGLRLTLHHASACGPAGLDRQHGESLLGLLFLLSFGIGQVLPLLLAGSVAASIPN